MNKDVAFLTGIGGFLCSHVADALLARGIECVGLDDLSGGSLENIPAGVKFYEGSICDEQLVNHIFGLHRPRWVFHLASYAAEGLSPYIRRFNYEVNVVGSAVVTSAAVNFDAEGIVFTSSIATFGCQQPPFNESTPEQGDDPYALAKICTTADLRDARHRFGLKYIIFKPFNIYGERQNMGDRFRNVVGIHMQQCLLKKPRTIFGDGEQQRSFSYISDVAPLIAESVFRELWGETFCIGGSRPYSVNFLSEKISAAMGVAHEVEHLEPRVEAVNAFCNTAKVFSIFPDLYSDIPLEDGLARMATWAKARGPMEPTKSPRIEIVKNLPPSWAKLQ